MAGRIRDEVIAAIRERLPIEQVIGDYVTLKPAGSARYKGLCPFHDEKTPSFNVNAGLGFYKCFGCGVGGDLISFVQEKENLTFVETVEVLARRAGVEITYEEGGAAPRQQSSERQKLIDAHASAALFERRRTDDARCAHLNQRRAFGVGHEAGRDLNRAQFISAPAVRARETGFSCCLLSLWIEAHPVPKPLRLQAAKARCPKIFPRRARIARPRPSHRSDPDHRTNGARAHAL